MAEDEIMDTEPSVEKPICPVCGSTHINPGEDGRDHSHAELCDRCWWRQKAEVLETEQTYLLADIRVAVGDVKGSMTPEELKARIDELVAIEAQHKAGANGQ